MHKLRVAVLMGGTSAERAISLSTGQQILAALDPERYIPMALDAAALSAPPAVAPRSAPGRLEGTGTADAVTGESGPGAVIGPAGSSGAGMAPLVPLSMSQLETCAPGARPDVVFIALHGKGGEDGTVQGMLELLGLPYTGSGVLASALAMDKVKTKRFLRGEGIPVPGEIAVKRGACPDIDPLRAQWEAAYGYPAIVKPNAQGSTIGCAIVRGPEELGLALENAFAYDSTVLIEEFVTGVEITVGLLGNDDPEPLPIIEIEAKGGFYDYEAKYAPGGSTHIIPARISETAAARARDYAVRCHTALGCRGMSRVDMIVAGDQPYVLEINTIPGMTPTSLLPDAARAAGIGFSALLDRLIGYALEPE